MKKKFSFTKVFLILSIFVILIKPGYAELENVKISDNTMKFMGSGDGEPEECTALIAGKKTTVDGSIIFAKSEDDSSKDIDYFWYIPRKKFNPGSVVKLKAGGTIPQVEETYAYFWDECPGTSYSNGIINEWGVAFGSNGCTSKEDPVEKVEERGDLCNGGLGFKFRMILAERSKTAREAVLLAAKLLDKYGYNASGRNLNIVGPKEAWQLQIVRGKNYVARRVQDDEVAIIGNTFSIREVDMNDKENFICSPSLIDYAKERGWYDSSSEEKFDFSKAYAPQRSHCNPANTHRQWYMAQRLNKNFPITWREAQTGIMPVSVKPDRKLSLKDIMGIFRSHYEGTELDKSDNYEKNPHKSPFFTICNYGSHRATIVQQREWLPVEIGTVTWRVLERPCSNVFIPWYLGITRIPDIFHKAPESLYTTKKDLLDYHFNMPKKAWWNLDLESSATIFKILAKLVDANYKRKIKKIQKTWKEFEEREFAMQPVIEESALKLYKKDKSLAKEFLTFYSSSQALKSLEVAKNLIGQNYLKKIKGLKFATIPEAIIDTIEKKNIESAIKLYWELKKSHPHFYDFSESMLNRLGYKLIQDNKLKEAVEIFNLNIEIYPQSSNVYDSYAEGLINQGKYKLAIKNYQKSLELNPNNGNATKMIKKMKEYLSKK